MHWHKEIKKSTFDNAVCIHLSVGSFSHCQRAPIMKNDFTSAVSFTVQPCSNCECAKHKRKITKTRHPCNRQGDSATGLGQILSTEASSVADKHPRNLMSWLPKKGATTNLPHLGNAKQMISLQAAQVHVKHITQIKY